MKLQKQIKTFMKIELISERLLRAAEELYSDKKNKGSNSSRNTFCIKSQALLKI